MEGGRADLAGGLIFQSRQQAAEDAEAGGHDAGSIPGMNALLQHLNFQHSVRHTA
jgi:hypothetical protein